MANKHIKSADLPVIYTDVQKYELQACMDPLNGPYYFINNFVKVQHPVKGAIPLQMYPFQHELLRTYHDYQNSIAMISRQCGKALPLDTEILTPNGYVRLGNLSVGDTIFGDDGKPTKIRYITETMYDRPCYKITFADGTEQIADAWHKWKVNARFRGDYKTREYVMYTRTFLRKRMQDAKYTITKTKPVQFEKQKVVLPPYAMGLWLGGGTKINDKIMCSFSGYIRMQKLLKARGLEVSDFEHDRGLEVYTLQKKSGFFTINGLMGELEHFGLLSNKHIPREYFFNDMESRIELIQGILDGSSSVSVSNKCIIHINNDHSFIENLSLLLLNMGIHNTVYQNKKKTRTSIKIYPDQCEYKLSKIKKSIRNVDFTLNDHHYSAARYHTIKSVTKIDSVPVRCLQVDNKSHMFLCNRKLIPTHNTTIAGSYLLWFAMFKSDSHILIAANKFDSALDIGDRIRYTYENLPDHIRPGVVEYNKTKMKFDNGSKIEIHTTTETTGRGRSVSLFYLDEFAFVEPRVAREFWTSISPTLSTGGKCLITSTPNSDQDQFSIIWREANNNLDRNGNITELGANGFRPYKATWDKHPERDEQWAIAERSKIGEERFKREHDVEFITFEETLINQIQLSQCKAKEPIEREGTIRWYERITKGKPYIVSWDVAMGGGGTSDYAAIVVYEAHTMVQVAEWQDNRMIIENQAKMLKKILKRLSDEGASDIYWTLESNAIGQAALMVVRQTGENNFAGLMVNEPPTRGSPTKRKGLYTTHRSKLEACSKFKSLFENGKMKINSQNLLNEMKNFVAYNDTYRAKSGETDDLISATLGAIRVAMIVSIWDESIYSNISSSILDGDDEFAESSLMPLPIAFI